MSQNYDLREAVILARTLRVGDTFRSGGTVIDIQQESGDELSVDLDDGRVEVYAGDSQIRVLI
jgi:hypothetical protein